MYCDQNVAYVSVDAVDHKSQFGSHNDFLENVILQVCCPDNVKHIYYRISYHLLEQPICPAFSEMIKLRYEQG